MKKKKVLKISLLILLAIILIIVFMPARTPSIAGENSIAELTRIELGGIEQSILIRGNNIQNPVLLKLHGGPGGTEMPVSPNYHQRLEEHFTVVNWDQRGTGKSYSKVIPQGSMTIDQIVADTHELTTYLKERFNKEKIYLLGHSFGTIVGFKEISAHPDDYQAYISVSQATNSLENDKLSYAFITEEAKARNDEEGLEEINQIGAPPFDSEDEIFTLAKYVAKYGGTFYEDGKQGEFLRSALLSPEYNFFDYFKSMQGSRFSIKHLRSDIQNTNLFEEISEVKVPVYMMIGKYDRNTVASLQEDYFNHLEAPVKEKYIFEESAHSPHFEEPDTFMNIMIDEILAAHK